VMSSWSSASSASPASPASPASSASSASPNNRKHSSYKTVLCKNPPPCPFGSTCNFAHGPGELRPEELPPAPCVLPPESYMPPPAPEAPGSRVRALRELHLELQNLQKLKLFLESEAAHPAPDADAQVLRGLQLELGNLSKLEACLARQATVLMSNNDERSLAFRLFMSKFEYGP
jgi:hypothetical protein